jgi:hypothetical protein
VPQQHIVAGEEGPSPQQQQQRPFLPQTVQYTALRTEMVKNIMQFLNGLVLVHRLKENAIVLEDILWKQDSTVEEYSNLHTLEHRLGFNALKKRLLHQQRPPFTSTPSPPVPLFTPTPSPPVPSSLPPPPSKRSIGAEQEEHGKGIEEARFLADPGMAQELHNRKRSIHRRKRFVRTQQTIAHIAYTIGGGRRKGGPALPRLAGPPSSTSSASSPVCWPTRETLRPRTGYRRAPS